MTKDALRTASSRHAHVMERLARLPQAAVLDTRDALAWIERVKSSDPERLDFHLLRLGGIGGSESSAAVAWAVGGLKSRKTVQSLVRDKLLRRTPDRPNADMLRGSFLEEHVRAVFERRLDRDGARWERLQAEEVSVSEARPAAYPWLRASPDGLYRIDGRTVLVDFKCPTADSLRDQLRTEGNDDYKVQLNHYEIVAGAAGVRIDDLWLAFYDYNRAATDGVQVLRVASDGLLQQRIVESTGEVWNEWVMRGVVPPYEPRMSMAPGEAPPPEIEEAAVRAAGARLLAKAATETYEAERTRVSDWFGRHGRVGEGHFRVGRPADGEAGLMTLKAREELDIELAVERLSSAHDWNDVELEELRADGSYDLRSLTSHYDRLRAAAEKVMEAVSRGELPEPAVARTLAARLDARPTCGDAGFDPAKVEEALVACGEVPYEYRSEVVSVTLDRRERGDVDSALVRSHRIVDAALSEGLFAALEDSSVEFMDGVPHQSL